MSTCKSLLIALVVLLFCSGAMLHASPAISYQAETLVRGWLNHDPTPLNTTLGQQIQSVQTFTDEYNRPLYYVVYLAPAGFVIVPADDLVEPIVGFAPDGYYDPSQDNPLGALVENDIRGRLELVRDIKSLHTQPVKQRAENARTKWDHLSALAFESTVKPLNTKGLASIDDVRVAPLVQTRWNQTTVCTPDPCACYNYYTPPNAAGNKFNYPSGCTATALAQIMKYHEYPTSGIGTDSFDIKINGAGTTRSTVGGDESGGAYDWDNMINQPGCGATLTQRKAIGALCHDAGVGISNLVPGENRHTNYGGTTTIAFTDSAKIGLLDTFDYGNAVFGYKGGSTIGAGLTNMLNPNLDAELPVFLGIKKAGTSTGHAVVCDGYGFDSGTMYHHINMGWSGSSDAWYQLPNITSTYDSVYETIYNLSPSDIDEIISGRVTTTDGTPIANATVHGDSNDCFDSYVAVTNAKGIYALGGTSNCHYTVSVSKNGYFFDSQELYIAQSQDEQATSANRWGVDFNCVPPQISSATPSSGPCGSYIKIEGDKFGNTPGQVMFYCLPVGSPYAQILDWNNTTIYCRVPDYTLDEDFVIISSVGIQSDGFFFDVTGPNTIYVDAGTPTPNSENGSETYPFSKIERGIYPTSSGATIVVSPGTNIENIDPNGRLITITSTDPNDPDIVASTIIDGNGVAPVVTFDANEDANCLLTGFTIKNGYSEFTGGGIYCFHSSPTISRCLITQNNPDWRGGGIYCMQNACPIFSHCTISDNNVPESAMGAGVFCGNDSNAVFIDCNISDNTAGYGGAAVYNNTSKPTFRNCIFKNNTLTDEATYGGAINNYDSDPTLINCSFINNYASWHGGALYNNWGSDPILIDCTFINNTASQGGGAVSNNDNAPVFINCSFIDNSTDVDGGAMINFLSSAQLTDCIFTANLAEDDGGAVFSGESPLQITNCTFTDNYAEDKGGALYHEFGNFSATNQTLTNCIVWANTTPQIHDFQSTTTVTYTDIEGGHAGAGNINSDPCFVAPGYWADINDVNVLVEPNDPNATWINGDYGGVEKVPICRYNIVRHSKS